ncbi:DUF6584 family protein [Umezawaea beigongshangensis]|uniref:DUF6584 family protein n=1 Tax=Umezawaea beigongshangensis TaxID=2780383 RepID=UPI0018F1762E|nr:DUF6584 family protein [Umezawaea beigongshangensis]
MPVEVTLRRAAEEVTRGDLASVLRARQRLSGLVGTYPGELEIRARLAHVYRVLGDSAQAGRWSYLAEVRDPVEVAAFERAYRDPVRRLVALAWSGDPASAGTDAARARLIALHDQASEHLRREVRHTPPERRSWPVALGLLLLGALFLVCFAIGLVTLVTSLPRWFTG